MSTSLSTMIRLRAIQNKTRELFEGMNDTTYRLQFHKDLSPMGWYLGHCMFIENYWLHEIIQKNSDLTRKNQHLYSPDCCPKSERGAKLSSLKPLLQEIKEQQDINDLMLIEMIPPLSDHTLFEDEYIENFIIQNYAHRYEEMQMVLNQIAIKKDRGQYQPNELLTAKNTSSKVETLLQGEHDIGCEENLACDNEKPSFKLPLKAFNIATHPVTNAEYLSFIESGGYSNNEHWCKNGQLWLTKNNIQHPEHWSQNNNNEWYGVKHQGPFDLEAGAPLYGINYFEARAFANWAGARLPHEHEWEAGVKSGQLHNTGLAWEWCSNRFFPYEDFKPSPYDGYSKPFFDNRHYVLRGGSRHTRPEIRRASFRNFYTPEKRHIFAGLRLVF
jgi:gamma-glutamyl hercynylcysteine S-oxide synthase